MDNEFKNKNDYSCTAYLGSTKVNFMKYVNSIYAYVQFLEKNNIDWSVINIYTRRTNRFICRQYKGDFIQNKPK